MPKRLTTPESQRRIYIVAMLLCSVFPASVVFWGVGFLVGMMSFGIDMSRETIDLMSRLQVIQIIGLTGSAWIVYRFWIAALQQVADAKPNGQKTLLKKPQSATGLLVFLLVGFLSVPLGISSIVVGWLMIDIFYFTT